MAVIIFLILQQPATPPVDPDPYAGERVQRKLDETRRAVQSGRPHVLELNEAEVNSWLGKNLVFAEMPYEVEDVLEREASLEQVRSTVRNLQVNLSDDEVHAHVVFDFHGKDLKLEIRGKLSLLDGYLKLVPTGGKLGALPIPRAALDRAMSRVFNSPENREKFKVPDQVADLRVEDGEFRVVYR